MGGADIGTLISIFLATKTPNPTKNQLHECNPGCDIVNQIVGTYEVSGEVVREGEHFRLSEKVIVEGIGRARKKLEFWQGRIDQLEQLKSVKV